MKKRREKKNRIVEENTVSESDWEENDTAGKDHEDIALKMIAQFFADEIMPYLGIEGKVISFAPTELPHIELQKFLQDFNYVVDDGSWKHFEFQSKNEGKVGLKRFRVYEALASYQHGVEVTTYVLFSGNVKNPMTELKEGVNTYRIVPIIMQDYNADELIGRLKKKAGQGERIEKSELVPLTLCPLMGGNMSQKDRIAAALGIVKNVESVNKEDSHRIAMVIYAMADKFLEKKEKDELMEVFGMTELGQMLVEHGMKKGMVKGIEKGIEKGKSYGESIKLICLVRKKVAKGMDASQIAEMLEEDEIVIDRIVILLKEYGESSDESLAEKLQDLNVTQK